MATRPVCLSISYRKLLSSIKLRDLEKTWRRGRDSNPGSPKGQRFSRPPRSTAPAPLRGPLYRFFGRKEIIFLLMSRPIIRLASQADGRPIASRSAVLVSGYRAYFRAVRDNAGDCRVQFRDRFEKTDLRSGEIGVLWQVCAGEIPSTFRDRRHNRTRGRIRRPRVSPLIDSIAGEDVSR